MRHFLPLFTSLDMRAIDTDLARLLADDGTYVIAGSPRRPKYHMLAYFRTRSHELVELDEVIHQAWDLAAIADHGTRDSGKEKTDIKKQRPLSRTVLYESTIVCKTIHDPDNFKLEKKGLSILELEPLFFCPERVQRASGGIGPHIP